MQSVRMLKQRAIWMREKGFDRIEVIIEMHEETLRRLYAGFDPERLYNDCTVLDDSPLSMNLPWTWNSR